MPDPKLDLEAIKERWQDVDWERGSAWVLETLQKYAPDDVRFCLAEIERLRARVKELEAKEQELKDLHVLYDQQTQDARRMSSKLDRIEDILDSATWEFCTCCGKPATHYSRGRSAWVCAEHLLIGEGVR